MRSHEESVLIARIESQGPDPLTGQSLHFRINARPRRTPIDRSIDAASDFACLIRVTGEHFVAVPGVDQDARKIAEGKIPTAPAPVCSTVLRHIESLLRADIDMAGALQIPSNRIDRSFCWDSGNLLPRLPCVMRNQHSRRGGAHPDCF